MTDDQLEMIFKNLIGGVEACYIKVISGKQKNLGFVTFKNESQVKKALDLGQIKIEKTLTLSLKKFFVKQKQNIDLEKILNENFVRNNNYYDNSALIIARN
jgi:RNA recognition motif-containing protein